MPQKWSEIVKDPYYINLNPEGKSFAKQKYWDKVISQDPEFISASPIAQEDARKKFERTITDNGKHSILEKLFPAEPPIATIIPPITKGLKKGFVKGIFHPYGDPKQAGEAALRHTTKTLETIFTPIGESTLEREGLTSGAPIGKRLLAGQVTAFKGALEVARRIHEQVKAPLAEWSWQIRKAQAPPTEEIFPFKTMGEYAKSLGKSSKELTEPELARALGAILQRSLTQFRKEKEPERPKGLLGIAQAWQDAGKGKTKTEYLKDIIGIEKRKYDPWSKKRIGLEIADIIGGATLDPIIWLISLNAHNLAIQRELILKSGKVSDKFSKYLERNIMSKARPLKDRFLTGAGKESVIPDWATHEVNMGKGLKFFNREMLEAEISVARAKFLAPVVKNIEKMPFLQKQRVLSELRKFLKSPRLPISAQAGEVPVIPADLLRQLLPTDLSAIKKAGIPLTARIATQFLSLKKTGQATPQIVAQLKPIKDIKAVEGVRPVPTELEPLAVEARKYKSGEEFVKGIVYHGQGVTHPIKGAEKITGGISRNLKAAQAYAGFRGIGNERNEPGGIVRVIKISDLTPEQQKIIKSGGNISALDYKQEITPIATLDAENAKSQLTDFYAQATKGVEPPTIIPETEKSIWTKALGDKAPILYKKWKGDFVMAVKDTTTFLSPKQVQWIKDWKSLKGIPLMKIKKPIKKVPEEESWLKMTSKQEELIHQEMAEEKAELDKMNDDYRKEFFGHIKELGGIKKDPLMKEEELEIPTELINNTTGSYLEELATEIAVFGHHFEDGQHLRQTILSFKKPPLQKSTARETIAKTIRAIQSAPKEEALKSAKALNKLAAGFWKELKETTLAKTKEIIRKRRMKMWGKLRKEKEITKEKLARTRFERKFPPTTQEMKNLRKQIHTVVDQKGLTNKKFIEIKQKYGGIRHLVSPHRQMSIEQLQAVLKAVQQTRPKRIGWKRVITKKTERKIQDLRENLKKKIEMTDTAYHKILQDEGLVSRTTGAIIEPAYTDAKHFITEEKGKSIIHRMLDEAHIIKQTESFDRAIKKNPEINKVVGAIDKKIDIEKGKSLKDPQPLESMRYYMQRAEIKTESPIFNVYQDLVDTRLDTVRERGKRMDELKKSTPMFKKITKDEKALKRVSDYIASKSYLKGKPKMPVDISNDEIALAKEMEKILKGYEYKVRTAKFFNYYYYNKPIADYDRYAEQINKAVDIFESKGKEALVEYLKTQEWGVIKSGYEPLQVVMPRIIPYEIGGATVGKSHINIRLDMKYNPQEKNIIQRLSSYMRQIDNLFEVQPKMKALIRLYDDNLHKFTNPYKIKEDIERFLAESKGFGWEGGFMERVIRRLYSQAMRVVIMPNPILAFVRNFPCQNIAFEHDKSILIDPRNKNLTDKDIEYIETFVLQTKPMIEDWFMTGEKPLPGLGFLTKLIDKVKIYPLSDVANRYWGFWAKINQVRRALKAKTVKGMMGQAKFDDMAILEQKRALSILARDGEGAMARYVAKVHTDDIHFLYERSQRSPAEMGSLGRVVGNLMLFPRAYWEKLVRANVKLMGKNKSYWERWRGLKMLFSVIIGGLGIGMIYKKVTGRRRNPYNPLELLAYTPGGLMWGAIETVGEVYSNMIMAVGGDEKALAALAIAVPKSADMFIPFYSYALRGFEAATDTKNIDRKAIRKIREMLSNEYKVRNKAYKLERNALEKWQYFLAGAGVDVTIKEKKKKTGMTFKSFKPLKSKGMEFKPFK